jgi:hypothetical protein
MSKLLVRNEGNLDRGVRVVAGVGLLGLLAVGPVPGWGLVGLIGIVPLVTGALGSCPLYTLLGVSTCPMKATEG